MKNFKHGVSWKTILGGPFEFAEDQITYRGIAVAQPVQLDPNSAQAPEPAPPKFALAACSERLAEGSIHVEIEFEDVKSSTCADIVLQRNSQSEEWLTVGMGSYNDALWYLRQWVAVQASAGDKTAGQSVQTKAKNELKIIGYGGNRGELKAHHSYVFDITVRGAIVKINIDDVEVATYTLPTQLPGNQVGILCRSDSTIYFRNFSVQAAKPQAFVAMQFNTEDYDQLYDEVIRPVCDEFNLRAYRADETYGPGLVVMDIQAQIAASRVVIAEITSQNVNVLYEVGYADALKKPVILFADKQMDKLPFDVRPYRVIVYENKIGGKTKVMETLRKYLSGITGKTG